jgi:hypothetical protein
VESFNLNIVFYYNQISPKFVGMKAALLLVSSNVFKDCCFLCDATHNKADTGLRSEIVELKRQHQKVTNNVVVWK